MAVERAPGWFQPFELVAGLAVGSGNSLVLSDRGRSINLVLGSTYYPLSTVPNEAPETPSQRRESLPLVFAGFGLSAAQASYDDYAGLDVSGKAVLIFSHEPQEADRNSSLNGNRPMPESRPRKAETSHNRDTRPACLSFRRTRPTKSCTTPSRLMPMPMSGMPVRGYGAMTQPLLYAWGSTRWRPRSSLPSADIEAA